MSILFLFDYIFPALLPNANAVSGGIWALGLSLVVPQKGCESVCVWGGGGGEGGADSHDPSRGVST